MIANEYHMGRKAGASILHSVRSAETLGRPLNTFVTINFWQLGSTAETIFRDFADLREAWFQRWSSYRPRKNAAPRNGVPTYAYVHEARGGDISTVVLPPERCHRLHLDPEMID